MQLNKKRDLRRRIQVDNGLEFISKRLDQWVHFNRVELGLYQARETIRQWDYGGLQRTVTPAVLK